MPNSRSSASASRARNRNGASEPPDHPAVQIPLSRAAKELLREERTGPHLDLPFSVHVTLPPVEHLIYYGAIGLLLAVDMIDWPIAVVVAVGKALADNRHYSTLKNVGEALQQAG